MTDSGLAQASVWHAGSLSQRNTMKPADLGLLRLPNVSGMSSGPYLLFRILPCAVCSMPLLGRPNSDTKRNTPAP